jgi:hypothetical protein
MEVEEADTVTAGVVVVVTFMVMLFELTEEVPPHPLEVNWQLTTSPL